MLGGLSAKVRAGDLPGEPSAGCGFLAMEVGEVTWRERQQNADRAWSLRLSPHIERLSEGREAEKVKSGESGGNLRRFGVTKIRRRNGLQEVLCQILLRG